MQEVPQRQGIFYGWMIVATALVIIAWGVGFEVSDNQPVIEPEMLTHTVRSLFCERESQGW